MGPSKEYLASSRFEKSITGGRSHTIRQPTACNRDVFFYAGSPCGRCQRPATVRPAYGQTPLAAGVVTEQIYGNRSNGDISFKAFEHRMGKFVQNRLESASIIAFDNIPDQRQLHLNRPIDAEDMRR
jgi:hypothetical protein